MKCARGLRKLYVYTLGVAALGLGLWACSLPNVAVAYAAFATAVVSLATAVVLGNVGEHIAGRGKSEEPKS